MKALGIVFLYDRAQGPPDKVSKEFSDRFAAVSENLVKEGLINLPELKDVMDFGRIYWGGIKERFAEILKDENAIGGISIQVFENHSGMKAGDQVKSLLYDGSKTPWGFDLVVSVIYSDSE
ncbi:MAG: hypothetical protein ACTSVV_08915 [Promethearchaeota archaeon]